ncbi:MAG TPA: lysophospholipid acyltransferase family protein [Gemmatimonadales bacterium]|nr:lysophospholipid acyltransferase family protein [Gemmatimonadales bacterium]
MPPRPPAVWAFARYCRAQFGRYFTTIRWATQTDTDRWDRGMATLFVANHTNWWDGLFAFLLGGELRLTFHILMDATQLERYRAFRWIGVLPIRRSAGRAGYEDLLAAGACLRPGAGLWVFPQGARRPQGERPARFERGAAELALAHGAPVRVCPVAFRYVFLGEQLPEAFALVGRPRLVEPGGQLDRRALTVEIERDTALTVDALDALLRAETLGSFRILVRGRLSVNKRMDRFRHAVGLLRGPFEARNG